MVAYYYVDYTNGVDTHTGLRIPVGDWNSTSYNIIDSTADTTHFVDSVLGAYADDALIGSYFYNVTRSLGSLITDNTTGTGAVVLGTAIAGMAADDTYYILDSVKTLLKATQTLAPAAGDFIYHRANQTSLPAADVTFAASGTVSARCSLIGCSTTIDPYHDATDTRTIINFNAAAYQVYQARSYWDIKNLQFKNSTDTNGVFYNYYNTETVFTNCLFNNASNYYYTFRSIGYTIRCDSCTFEGIGASGSRASIQVDNGDLFLTDCTLNATVSTVTGITCGLGTVYLKNCSFGVTNAFTTADINCGLCGRFIAQNCKFTTGCGYTSVGHGSIHSEDHNQVSNAHYFGTYAGTIVKDTGVLHSGGASSSALMVPSANCNSTFMLELPAAYDSKFFAIWCPAESTTITFYIRGYGTWTTVPTAAELYLQASYYTAASPDATRATENSTAILTQAAQTDWVAFPVTVVPGQAGFVYCKIHLEKYQASCGCYVDVLPVVS